jgi:hypothetical protein
MKVFKIICLIIVTILFLFPNISFPIDLESYSCMVCHGEKKVEYLKSFHWEKGLWCADCHGGDPSSLDQEVSMSSKAGFKGKPSKKELVLLCGNCHADKKRMRQYGIPTDQLEYYRTSEHGIALLARNDANVAGCVDCHGSHTITAVKDPLNKVFPTNLPQTCAACHSDKKLMEQYRLPYNTLEEYVSSVHGKALLEKNDRSAPTCAGCHGNHGAAPPGVTEVGNVCGKCHINAETYFAKSPHSEAMQKKKMSQCTSCHGNHSIKYPEITLFDQVCSNCHDPNSGAYKRGQQIKTLILEAKEQIDKAKELIAKAKAKGQDISGYENQLEQANTDMLQVLPVTHTLAISDVETITNSTRTVAGEIASSVHNYLESLRMRKVGLGIVWLFVFFVVVILYLKVKRADREYELSKEKEKKWI